MADIAIIGDNAKTAATLAQCLGSSSELHLAGSYPSRAAALKCIPRKPPSLVFVDFKLVDMSGLVCARRLHLLLPRLLIVLFNAEPELAALFEAFRAGAVGFLDHRVPFDEIPSYAQLVLHGGVAISRDVGHKLAAASQQWENLTERESAIVSGLLTGQRQKEVAKDLGMSARTLETHLRRLYRKHDVHNWKAFVQKTLPLDPSRDQ